MGTTDERSLADFEDEERRILALLHQSRKTDWDNRVQHHPPRTESVVDTHEQARALVGQVGHELLDLLPPCPEVNQVLDALHLALLHANTAIALHHPDNAAA